MKPLPRLCITAALAVTLSQPSHAQNEEFNTEKMLQDLEQQLRLKKEDYDKLKPELEQALAAKSKELKRNINEAVDKGFVELEKMSQEMDAASEQTKQKLEEALNSEQVQALKEFLNNIDESAIQAAYQELVDELAKLLALTQEQIEKIGPVIKDALANQAELLSQFAQDTGKKFEQFRKEWETLSENTRQKLKDTLDPAQLEKLEQRIGEIRDTIRNEIFKGG